MVVDRYTKAVLTVIAACLIWLCAMTTGRPAQAQQLTAVTSLPGGAQPVVIVGWGSMDMEGRVALQLATGGAGPTHTDATLPVRADRALPVKLPYTPADPLPAKLTSTHDNPLSVEIAAIRKNSAGWEPIRTEVEPAATRDKPGRQH
jgi:hypothetical protein